MIAGVPKETATGETRVAVTPATTGRLRKLGLEVVVENGAGLAAGFTDESYAVAGARLTAERGGLLSSAGLVLRVRRCPDDEVGLLAGSAVHASFLDPFAEKPLLAAMAARGLSTISMEMVPRSTRAQKMDALTSQANLGGYVAVLLGATRMNKILPMMSTAAGTLLAGKVFVIGAGVAGLQAIATARRLGARVEAFDTRPVVAEQVRSLGAKFVEIDLGGETGQTEQGYARELTPEQLARQREGMKACCAAADLVITTAQVFGRPAPRIVTHDMVAAMRPGSVIVDMAVESGGNVDGSVAGRTEDIGGVLVVGETNLPGRVAQHASQVYAMNLFSLVEEFWDKESKTLRLDPSDDILASCLLTHAGEVRDERFRLT
jgi:NAD(P) transhydrogenase subunit alpha